MFWNKITGIAILVLLVNSANAQQFGGHPAGQQWKQIRSDSFRVIFPAGQSANAQRVSSIIKGLDNGFGNRGLKRFSNIPIVLQHKTNISNGYVGMGPWRSEFFLTPDQNSFELGSIPWLDVLSLHEYRHVQQNRHFMQGITGATYKILGQLAGVVVSGAAVPNWFWEGDAVWQETRLSGQGRGRIPSFFNGYRSLWNSGKEYSWMKLRNGSLVDYVPNHYQLGYLLSSFGHERYGEEMWSRVTSDAVRFKGLFYPFQKAVKKQTGTSYSRFTDSALNTFKQNVEQDSLSEYAAEQEHYVQSFEFPQWLNDSLLVAVRSSYKQIPKFVVVNERGEFVNEIGTRYISLDRQFSFKNGRIVYAGFHPHERWGFRDFHDIVLLDVLSGEQKFITHKKRYFSPDINDPGTQIITVSAKEDGSNELHLLNGNGSLMKIIDNSKNVFYSYPKFFDERSVVSAVRNENGQMALIKINLVNDSVEELIPFSNTIIGFTSVHNLRISFTASSNQAEENYTWEKGIISKIKDPSNLGVYQPSEHNGKFVMQGFSSAGDQLIFSASIEQENNFPVVLNGPYPFASGQQRSIKKQEVVGDSSIYHKGKNLFNFHSIIPTFSDPDYNLSIVSDNVLNNFSSEINLQYNTNEQYKKIGFSILYGGLFPWIRAGVDYTADRNFFTPDGRAYFNQVEARVGLQLPLNLSGGKNYRYLNSRIDYVHNDGSFQGKWKDSFAYRSYGYINPVISFSNRIQQAVQHIYPRLGYNILVDFRKSIVNRTYYQLNTNNFLLLPGFKTNHNLVIQAAMQLRDPNIVAFTNNFPMSRGYVSVNEDKMYRLGVNYHFPMFYPDWGFGNLIYFLRIRGNAFYDHSIIKSAGRAARNLNSTGVEIFFDTKWWNQENISFGFRITAPFDYQFNQKQSTVFDFILPVNIFNR
jgi:hypothetical protein